VRIDEIIATEERPVFSFEFFPPKTDDGERNLRAALAELRSLEPDFASVTYGAAGSTRTRTLEVTRWLQQELGIEAMAHLSCVGATREELAAMVDGFVEAGISNILALRGDPPRDQPDYQPHPGGLSYSHELASLITERHPELCVGAACFPEIHPDAGSRQDDLRYLAAKIDSGRRDRGADPARNHADHRSGADQDDHRAVWGDDPGGAARAARAPRR
jgi:methylenetetrahydrofolate reductase (NADPH)